MRSTPAPGCCIDRPVADMAAVAGDPTRAVSVLLLDDRRTGAGVLIVDVEGPGR